jgi:hypothetical protein
MSSASGCPMPLSWSSRGDHAHHIESIDAFLAALEEQLTRTEEARMA